MDIKVFKLLRFLSKGSENATQRAIAKALDFSLGATNKLIAQLIAEGLIDEEYRLTQAGVKALEPYKVDNAIILAAGMSTRFVPISYDLPKGLISVKGEVLIERLIRQLKAAGVEEIVVVVGYMMEKFIYLREKFGVKLVVNNEFSEKNTHSSVYAARDYLKNTYICCSDNYYPENMFERYEYRAYYCSIFLPGTSYVERAFTFDKDGLIIDTNKPSHDQWIMYGHAYFSRSFTALFKPILKAYYGRPGVENMYWETIYAECVKDLPMYIKRCRTEEILEFDSMDELKAFDPDFTSYNKVKVFDNIAKTLGCKQGEIGDIEIIKKGLNNKSFKFSVHGKQYVYRHPGKNAQNVIDRKKEAASLRAAKKLKVDDSLIFVDENEGWKISKFIEVTETFDFANKKHIAMLAEKIKTLHDANIHIGFSFDYYEEADRLLEIMQNVDRLAFEKMLAAKNQMAPVFDLLKNDPWQKSLCHNDIYEPNLLVSNDTLNVIDWEFAGDSDIGYDICKLFSLTDTPPDKADQWLSLYYGRSTTPAEKRHLYACAAVIYYYWFVWGIYAVRNGDAVSDYLIDWYDKMNEYRDIVVKEFI